MFRRIRLALMKAKALSVLQSAYGSSLKEPLSPLINLMLSKIVVDTDEIGGNGFDAAAGYALHEASMVLQSKPELSAEDQQIIRGALTNTIDLFPFMNRPDDVKAVLMMVSDMNLWHPRDYDAPLRGA